MKRASVGSCILLVVSCMALLSILAVVVMHRVYYAARTSGDQVRQEQCAYATEAILRYGVEWYRVNRELIDSQQDEPGPWRISFDEVPLGQERCTAVVTIFPTKDEAEVSVELMQGRTVLSQMGCRVRPDSEEKGRLQLFDWSCTRA